MKMSQPRGRSQRIRLLAALIAIVLLFACDQSGIPPYKIPVTTNSETAREYYLEGRALAFGLRADEARQRFARAIEEDSSFALAYLEMARNASSNDELYENLDKAMALAADVSEGERIWIQAFYTYAVQGRPLKTRELYSKLVELYPRDELSHHLLAVHYFLQQQYKDCIRTSQETLELAPDFPAAYNVLGYAYQYEGDYELAEQSFQKYIKLIPAEPNPYDSYGDLLLKTGRFEEAISMYEQALIISPAFSMSVIGIASALNNLGRQEEARDRLYKALKKRKPNRMVSRAIARSFIEERQFDSALAVLTEVLNYDYARGDTVAAATTAILIGDVLLEAGKPKVAQQFYTEAIGAVQSSSVDESIKDKASVQYEYNLALIAIAAGKLDSAEVLAELHLETAREHVDPTIKTQAYFLKGMVALKRGQYDKALGHFELSDLHNPYHQYFKSLALRGMGQIEAADKLLFEARNANLKHSFPLAFVKARLKKVGGTTKSG